MCYSHMNDNIKYIIETHTKNKFLHDIIDDDDISSTSNVVNTFTHKYFPETNSDLLNIITTELNNGNTNLNIIDVSKITDFSNLFESVHIYLKETAKVLRNREIFKSKKKWEYVQWTEDLADDIFAEIDISDWNVSNGKNFSKMFYGCWRFNGDISNWDVGNGEDFSHMFASCTYFNSDISKWDMKNAVHLNEMFYECANFNQDIGNWNMQSAGDCSYMFYNCYKFNQDISEWKLPNCETCESMFQGCREFNQDIGKWDVSNIINFVNMFVECAQFNQDLSSWQIKRTSYNELDNMFYQAIRLSDTKLNKMLNAWKKYIPNLTLYQLTKQWKYHK